MVRRFWFISESNAVEGKEEEVAEYLELVALGEIREERKQKQGQNLLFLQVVMYHQIFITRNGSTERLRLRRHKQLGSVSLYVTFHK